MVLKATLAAGVITDNAAGRGQKHGHQAGADLSHPGERLCWPSQVAIGQTVRDKHILDRLGKQRKCNLPKKKKKTLGLSYKREKSKIFFNKVYSGVAKGEGWSGSLGLADASYYV